MFVFAEVLFHCLIAIAASFQVALSLGAPWAEYTMGGRQSGRLASKQRVLALIQAMLLVLFSFIFLNHTQRLQISPLWLSGILSWVIFAFFCLGSLSHIFVAGKKERLLWLPVNALLAFSSLFLCL